MRKMTALLLLCALLLGTLTLLSACDSAPADVVIGGNELIPNEKEEPGSTDKDDPSSADDGIGKNELVDLPYLPV